MANGEIRLTMTPADAGDTDDDGGGVPLVNALGAPVLASVNAQVVVDAIGLGATYALMAVGIGLVFGVLRLVNFAYGQLIMAGAYTLAYTSYWPLLWSIVACFAVVIALSLAMERAVFRPLREQSPTVMLVTTFAISFVLQSVALLIDIRDDQIGEPAASLAYAQQCDHDRRRRRAQGDDRRGRSSRSARSARSRCCSAAPRSACARARRRPTSARRACSASRPTR